VERMARDLNDRLYALLKDLELTSGKFDCECGDPDCQRSVGVDLHNLPVIRNCGGRVLSPEHLRLSRRRGSGSSGWARGTLGSVQPDVAQRGFVLIFGRPAGYRSENALRRRFDTAEC
jgi:hypothetical protein